MNWIALKMFKIKKETMSRRLPENSADANQSNPS